VLYQLVTCLSVTGCLAAHACAAPLSMQCGPHSVYLFSRLCGDEVAPESLKELIAKYPQGMSLTEVRSECQATGRKTVVRQIEASDLSDLRFPAIVYMRSLSGGQIGHFWILSGLTSDRQLDCIDATSARMFQKSVESFGKDPRFSGYVVVLESPAHWGVGTIAISITLALFGLIVMYSSFMRGVNTAAQPTEAHPEVSSDSK
jgi:ABC-type bacteriocin/lantibiotic exporter with double-glycine peptidase domain